jgi:sugar-phosphatase
VTFESLDAVLFDMDGTLVDSTEAVTRTWARWAGQHGLDVGPVMHVVHGRPAKDSIRMLLPDCDVEAEFAWILAAELEDTGGVAAIAGAKDLLATIGERWAIFTSAARPLAQHRLRIAGLPEPKVLVTFERLRRGKPDPEGYLLAAREIGARPERCLVVEDTPIGTAAGKAAGMRVLGIGTTSSRETLHCDAWVPDFRSVGVEIDSLGVRVNIKAAFA